MSDARQLRIVLETVRRHVERAAAGSGLQATEMTVDLRFGLALDGDGLVRPVLRTASEDTRAAPHSLSLVVSLTEPTSQ